MTKKIILLVLILPVIVMISLFTTTDAVSLAISIPVTGIDIEEDNIVYMDIKDKLDVSYTVYPTNATNQKVTMSMEPVGTSRSCNLDFDGKTITPKSVGVSKVYLSTVDGGFKDSFIIQVDSSVLEEIECSISEKELYVGEKASIYTEFIPETAPNRIIKYKSNNEKVATVDNRGFVTAVGRGVCEITIYSASDETIFDTVTVEVFNRDSMDISNPNVSTWNSEGSVNLSVNSDKGYKLSYRIIDNSGNTIETDKITIEFGEADENGNVSLNYQISDDYIGSFNIEVTITNDSSDTLSKVIKVNKVDKVQISFDDLRQPIFNVKSSNNLFLNVEPSNAKITKYEVETVGEYLEADEFDGSIIVRALKAGVSKIKVKAYVEGISEPIYCETDVIINPTALTIEEMSKSYGIEGIWTIGKTDYNNVDTMYKINLSCGQKELIGENFLNYVTYEVVDKDNKKVNDIQIDNEGNFKIISDTFKGDVYIRAVYAYGNYRKESEKLLVRCIGSGVNVYCYEDLLIATRNNKEVVLQENIKDDFGLDRNGNPMDISKTYREIDTTYDWTYYKNLGYQNPPKVKVLIEFKNNVYGNGYVINAHKIVYQLDSTGSQPLESALFQGPLNFVAVTESGSSAISVKAQDNIVFGVYENVNISNVELKGCDLQGSSFVDLKDLLYAGTTVEILGDNVNISYSRINNGRTVMRIFGDINDKQKVITTNINNCIISEGREFLIRMGSNAFIDGNFDNPAPYLPNNTVTKFPVYTSYVTKTEQEKSVYDNNFIKTYVNVKDSAFKNSGILSIGLDSHFAGPLLADGSSNKIYGGNFKDIIGPHWHDLAKTSYGAKLVFDGDVRIYDWKKLSLIDSTSLIDIAPWSGDPFQKMKFDIREMVLKLQENPNFTNILYSNPNYDSGENYIHGGIVVFGGGKNYSVFDYAKRSNTFQTLNKYEIGLDEAGKGVLEYAAGSEKFCFLMYNSTTNFNFLPQHQDELLNSEKAYEFIYKK